LEFGMEAMESHEKIEEAAGHSPHHGQNSHPNSKRIALLIAALAALLAISETAGKSAQTEAVNFNVTASNLWSFFQAKTIRLTTVRTAAENGKLLLGGNLPDAGRAAVEKQVDDWSRTAARYDSEPETGEGRKELSARAKDAEHQRDLALAKYHHFEYASAAFQLAIVLAGASALTAVAWLAFVSGGLGLIGAAFTFLGFFAPTLVHL
jgi:hypothetical protein